MLLLLVFAVSVSVISGCTVTNYNKPVEKYTGPYAEVDGVYSGTDDLGRVLTENEKTTDSERSVGIFYFLWIGTDYAGNYQTNYGPYDNSVVIEKFREQYPEGTYLSSGIWESLGGAHVNEQAYWGKPLFDYYTSSDEWVYRKHCQMLTDAGIDYIVFDTTNGQTFDSNVRTLISVWYEYLEAGYDVPKLAFYTHSDASNTMYNIYKKFYNNSDLKKRFPRLDELWYKWPYNGNTKPLIIGSSGLDATASSTTKKNWSKVTNYFYIRSYIWPNETGTQEQLLNGFPWMEFDRLYKYNAIYGRTGEGVINVSAAQHYPSICFSESWYTDPDKANRTRSYKCNDIFDRLKPAMGYNVKDEDAYLYGYNFADQWNFAISQNIRNDVKSVFVTGWNEWVATRQPSSSGKVKFVDDADLNNSRDIEPMEGGFGDNYYMQLINNIRRFKGTKDRVYVGDKTTIDISGSFDQWNSAKITAKYTDYKNDTADRNGTAWGTAGNTYKNTTGRNDFVSIKTCRDDDNVYFYAETAENITFEGGNPMTLFIDSGNGSSQNWEGYDFAVEITAADKAILKAAIGTDGKWRTVSDCEIKCEGNKVMLSVSRETINSPEYTGRRLVDIRFKWTDNCNDPETGSLSIFDFYKNGDAAPYGRMNYVFSEAPAK